MARMVVVLFGSISTVFRHAYFAESPLVNPETVFIDSESLFNPWVAGIITAAILSAIMSTIDSQLLCPRAQISEDIYRVYQAAATSESYWPPSRSCHRYRDSGFDHCQ